MNIATPFGFPAFVGVELTSLAGLMMIASAVVHIFFARGVKLDGERRRALGAPPLFAEPWVWALAVLVMGLPFLALYWLFHHSSWQAKTP